VPLNLLRGAAAPDEEAAKKGLAEIGLAVAEGTASTRMMVVHKP
jgi:hypothetical protein